MYPNRTNVDAFGDYKNSLTNLIQETERNLNLQDTRPSIDCIAIEIAIEIGIGDW